MDQNEIWKKICDLYAKTKRLTIQAEELSLDFKAFLQPLKELRDAYDHIIRAKSAELDILKKDEKYIITNYDKALGHQYRAFFDSADYISIRIREKIQAILEKYSSANIQAVIPTYYPTIRPELEKIKLRIAQYRIDKDIEDESTQDLNGLLQISEQYDKDVLELLNFLKDIQLRIPALEEFKIKEKKHFRLKMVPWDLFKIALGGAIALLITWLFKSR